MKTLPVLYQLARADFLERVRRYSFLITLGLTIYFAYTTVPPNHANYVTMQMSGHRGVYNSAYLGTLIALFTAIFLSFAGFYLVKNAIDRDTQTGVGQILAATPLTKSQYTLGKALSNFAVLAVMVGVMAAAAAAMQLVLREDVAIHAWNLLAPFLFLSLPTMTLVASVAVLFETIPWLRGGLGNVTYFFVWIAALIAWGIGAESGSSSWWGSVDLTGGGAVIPQLLSACDAKFPGCATSKDFSMGYNIGSGPKDLTTFVWDGVHWTFPTILARLVLVGLALGIALLAAMFFHRFDPAYESARQVPGTPADLPEPDVTLPRTVASPVSLSRMTQAAPRFRFGAMVLAELRLALKGVSRWWYAVAGGLIVAGAVTPVVISRVLLVAAWIWPILIWSAMGAREARLGTGQLVFSTVYPLRRQLPACWVAGVAVAALSGCGTLIRLLAARDGIGASAWMIGALFIPTLALALGVWSGGSKLFEVVYTLLWYIGPANRVPGFDFMGVTPLRGFGTPGVFLALTLILAALSLLGRKRQLQN
jgi:ABC-type transport system involved in multi-copper enzyme maturation permease subunit